MSKFEEFLRKKNRAKRFNEVLNNLNPGAEILKEAIKCDPVVLGAEGTA